MAKALGCSKGQVSKLVAKGMPLTSIDAARAWRAANSKEGAGHKRAHPSLTDIVKDLDKNPPPAPAEIPAETVGDFEAGLNECRASVRDIYAMIRGAIEKATSSKKPEDYEVIPGLHRNYVTALSNFLDLERKWERHQRSSGAVAPVDHLIEVLRRRLEPLDAQLVNFPRVIAAQANPQDPATAERAIEAGLESIRRQIASAQTAPVEAAPE